MRRNGMNDHHDHTKKTIYLELMPQFPSVDKNEHRIIEDNRKQFAENFTLNEARVQKILARLLPQFPEII